jgi:polysaccharide export outer membrane protein
MKPANLLPIVFLASALACMAQEPAQQPVPENTPASQPAADVAKPDAAKPDAVVPRTNVPAMTDHYVIGTTDTITVNVYKEPTLSGSMLVRPDGMISIPLLGDVKAADKTPLELAAEITAALKKYVQDPNVTVTLNGMNSKLVYLIGEVGKTGPIMMTPGMTLLQAIATAGGLGAFANAKKMYILRIEDGKQKKISVQYKLALRGDSSLNLTLIPGDTIVVP